MKDTLKNKIITSLIIMIIALLGIYFIVQTAPYPKVISQTIYREPDTIIKVELEDGWDCEKPKMTTDLLQPSGYWIGDTIDCWKLETPIEEYTIEQCMETKDDYWCDNITN